MMTIYRNEEFEKRTQKELETAAEVMQQLVTEFNTLGLGDVQQNELGLLAINPRRIYDARLELIEIPKGFNRSKYLEIMELPDLSPVLSAKAKYKPFEIYGAAYFTLRNGKVTLDKTAAKSLIELHTIELSETSPAYEPIKKIMDVMGTLNEINKGLDHSLVKPLFCKMDGFGLELGGVTGRPYVYNLKINPSKIKSLIKSIEDAKANSKQHLKN